MATLIFIPNDYLVAWAYRAPHMMPAQVVRVVRQGAWPFPSAWRGVLDELFIVPDGMRLLALAHGDLVVVRANVQLQQRVPGCFIPLNPGQAQVLQLMSQGFTTGQMACAMHMRRRWVKYRVAEVKRRLGAETRAEAVALAAERRGEAVALAAERRGEAVALAAEQRGEAVALAAGVS